MRPTRRSLAVGLVGLTLVGASLPAAAAATAEVVPVRFDIVDLVPGGRRSHEVTVRVVSAATVTAVELRSEGAPSLTWHARLCDQDATCRPVDDALVGLEMAPGTWTVTVTATAADDLQPGDRSDVVGRLVLHGGDVAVTDGATDGATDDTTAQRDPRSVLAGRTGPLALTGAALPAGLALALTATATGAWLVVLARRRRDEDTHDDGPQEGAHA